MNQLLTDIVDTATKLAIVNAMVAETPFNIRHHEEFDMGIAQGIASLLSVFGLQGTRIALGEPADQYDPDIPGYSWLGSLARGVVDAYIKVNGKEVLLETVKAFSDKYHCQPDVALYSLLSKNKLG